MAIPADIPDDVRVAVVTSDQLPADWRRYPAPDALAALGTRWAGEGATAVLAVPSALIPDERNYLLNPTHPRFEGIRIGPVRPFGLDSRLRKR